MVVEHAFIILFQSLVASIAARAVVSRAGSHAHPVPSHARTQLEGVGPGLDIRNGRGYTPLHLAFVEGRPDVVCSFTVAQLL